MSKKWMGLCSVMVVCMLAAGGCAKKEEAAQSEAVEEVDMSPTEMASPSAAGMYTAETASSKVMLMLNADNTASMSVDMMNNQPAVMESGSWTWNSATNAVDVMLQRDVSGTMMTSTMSFAMNGDTLSLSGGAEAGYGPMKLVKSAAGASHDSHEGHSH